MYVQWHHMKSAKSNVANDLSSALFPNRSQFKASTELRSEQPNTKSCMYLQTAY